jgi:hypothetical protein
LGFENASLESIVIALRAVKLLTDGIERILAVGWLLDRFRTTVNALTNLALSITMPGQWTQNRVADHPVEVWNPGGEPGIAAILLHDLDGQVPLRSVIEEANFPVICPVAGRTWWLSIESAGFPEGALGWVRDQVVPWASQQFQLQPPQFGLIGIGMGGHGALNLSYRHARKFPVVFAISAAVDFHIYQPIEPVLSETFESVEAARQQTATLHLHPLNWPLYQRIACDPADPYWFEGCERLASKLSSSGIPFDGMFDHVSSDRATYDRGELKKALRDLPEKIREAGRQLDVV